MTFPFGKVCFQVQKVSFKKGISHTSSTPWELYIYLHLPFSGDHLHVSLLGRSLYLSSSIYLVIPQTVLILIFWAGFKG